MERLKDLVLRAASSNKVLDSDIIRRTFRARSQKKVDNIMRAARTLSSEGVLKRLGRGVYKMNTTKKQDTIEEKINTAIKKGKQLSIEGSKVDGTPILRLGTPKEIKVSADGSKVLVFQDVSRKGYRSVRVDHISKLKYV